MELGGYKEDELWDAVSNRNIEEVKRSLAKGADATCIAPDGWVRSEASGKGGRSILHHAAYVGDLDVRCRCTTCTSLSHPWPCSSKLPDRRRVLLDHISVRQKMFCKKGYS